MWLNAQRITLKLYEKNRSDFSGANLEKVTALLDLGVTAKASLWGGYQQHKSDEKWERFYQELIQFQIRNGHLRVPRKSPTKQLNHWIDKQRDDYIGRQQGDKKSRMTNERVAKLASIGFAFSKPRMSWDDHFDLLREFKTLHGHTRVPVHYKGHTRLGEWTKVMRDTYVNGEMPVPPRKKVPDELRLAKLRGIGFDFEKRKRGLAGRGDADDSKFDIPIRQMNILENGCPW